MGRKPGTRAAIAGAALAAAYVLATAAAGWLGLVHGQPLLDSFVPPPPYRWLSPPPALAAGNQPPTPGTSSIDLGPNGSAAGVFSTPDLQATLILEKGAILPGPGATTVRLTIIPLDPASLAAPPPGVTVVGNAYRLQAVYRPSGKPVTRFAGPARVELIYPATAGTFHHRMLQLAAGTGATSWRTLTTTDTGTQLQLISDVASLGVFAAGQVGKASGGSLLRSLPALVLTVAAVAVSAWFALTALRDRARRSRAGRSARGSGGSR